MNLRLESILVRRFPRLRPIHHSISVAPPPHHNTLRPPSSTYLCPRTCLVHPQSSSQHMYLTETEAPSPATSLSRHACTSAPLQLGALKYAHARTAEDAALQSGACNTAWGM